MNSKVLFLELSAIGLMVLINIGFTAVVRSATVATVTATVTVQNISVTVTDGTITYGTLSISDTQDTTSSGLNDSQTATNNGNIDTDFSIKGQDSSNWTLSSAAGSEEYAHKFCTSDCDSSPVWNALTTTNQSLATSVAASGDQEFDLQISTPSSTTNYTQQSVDVIVTASAS